MKKYVNLIENIIVKELARIATLYKLSTTDDKELEQKIPDTIRGSAAVKNIIKYFKNNGNQPSSVIAVAKYYGYPAQQALNTQFQLLRNAGVLVGTGLAHPKAEKPISMGVHGRPITDPEQRNNYEKVKYIWSRLVKGEKEPNEAYKNWFINTYGEEKYQEFANIAGQYKDAILDKEASKGIKKDLVRFLMGIGIEVPRRGKPSKYGEPVNPQEPETDMEEPGAEEPVAENSPAPARTKPSPSREPAVAPRTKPNSPTRRRILTPPKQAPKTTPKAENKTVKKKVDFTKSVASSAKDYASKNQNETIKETVQNIVGKIVKRFKNGK